MPTRTPQQRAEMLRNVRKLGEVPTVPPGGLREALGLFKEIEAHLQAAEDDPELYSALMVVRGKVKEAMEARAQELGESDEWKLAMKGHDAMLMLRPLYRILDRDTTPETGQEYIDAYRTLSPEQRDALNYCENIAGVHLPHPEAIEAELRWNRVRLGGLLRFVPDLHFGSWPERRKAVFIGLFLVVGLALTIGNRSWVAALVFFALLAVSVTTWIRDLLYVMRRP